MKHPGLAFERLVAPRLPYRVWRAIETAVLDLAFGSQVIALVDRVVHGSFRLAALGDILPDPTQLKGIKPRLGSRLQSPLNRPGIAGDLIS